MERLLLIVEDKFLISKVGILLIPSIGSINVKVGDKVKLARPDERIIESKICGLTFEHRTIAVAGIHNIDEIPIGTEVWLID